MKILTVMLLTLSAINLQAQSTPVSTAIPPPSLPAQTSADLTYTNTSQNKETAKGLTVTLYKGAASRILIRNWPSGRITYVVQINGWSFYTDPTAPEAYKDVVTTARIENGSTQSSDFPELEFMAQKVTVTSATLEGKVVRLATGTPAERQFTDSYIANELKTIRDASERTEVEKSLREAQSEELKRGDRPPNQAWLDATTGLPLKVETEGQTITYTYHSQVTAPILPAYIIEAIKAKFGTMPPF